MELSLGSRRSFSMHLAFGASYMRVEQATKVVLSHAPKVPFYTTFPPNKSGNQKEPLWQSVLMHGSPGRLRWQL
jgi:hypothetical protein